ncbi:MAG: hypothetical protein J1E84_05355 [Muribaculaceae bacterium]|nr:hypothetical protein [Muribaculaceae bacterium]
MKFLKNIYIIFFALIIFFTTGCSNEIIGIEDGMNQPQPLVVIANIAGKAKTTSRIQQGTDDNWSYTDFENNDVMGFFSSAGNWLDDNGNGGFNNTALRYDANLKQFSDVNNGVEFSPTQISGSKIYMYYPYCADIETTGFELRDTDISSGDTLRCVDFLSSYKIEVSGVLNGKKMALFGEFDHAFSELIIMRGEGFDRPPKGKERITAVLSDPVTNIQVTINTDNGDWVVDPQLIYNENNKYNLSREKAYRWDAWHGNNYGITVQDREGRPAWYIIVPTIGSQVGKTRPGPRSMVQYIELFDNEGNLQQVTALRLSGGMTKYVDAGWRYPMEISMKEMVPTVNPYNIVPWNDDVNLTDQRTRGINNMPEFEDWVRKYNAYILEPTPERINELLKYGDLYVDEEKNNIWHFYLLTDLDMSAYNSSGSGDDGTTSDVIIPVLQDILDGEGTTLVNGKHQNHKIIGLDKTFVNQLNTVNGKITHIDFDEPDVRHNTTSPIGILANSITDGAIEDCNVDTGTLINFNGPAGFVCGTLANGSITGCTLEGFMVATSTGSGEYAKIVGTQPTGSVIFSGNNANGVTLGTNN